MPCLPSSEHVLICRLQIEQLLDSARWEEASDLGASVLAGAPWQSHREMLRIAVCLAKLGVMGGIDSSVLAPLLAARGSSHLEIQSGLRALHGLVDQDVHGFIEAIDHNSQACASDPSRFALLSAVSSMADAHTAPIMLASKPFGRYIRSSLNEANDAQRGTVTRAPAHLRLPAIANHAL